MVALHGRDPHLLPWPVHARLPLCNAGAQHALQVVGVIVAEDLDLGPRRTRARHNGRMVQLVTDDQASLQIVHTHAGHAWAVLAVVSLEHCVLCNGVPSLYNLPACLPAEHAGVLGMSNCAQRAHGSSPIQNAKSTHGAS